jgi:hypothetical protein
VRALLVLLALAGMAAGLAAQRLRPTLGTSVVVARVRSELPAGTDQFSGITFGGEGALSFGRLVLRFDYVQGSVGPVSGSAPARDLIEGGAQIGFRPLRWLTLGGGPRARAYVMNGRSVRWVFWNVRGRAESMFIGSAVTGYVEAWRAVSADVNLPEPFDYAQGGEAGIVLQLSRVPLQARVAYRIDHAALGAGSRLETVEGVVVALSVARR